MPDEMTYRAAVIEANRLKSQERMDVDRERLNAAIDKLIEAARFRISMKPSNCKHSPTFVCQKCKGVIWSRYAFCPSCGQAIDWSNIDWSDYE